MASSTEPTGRIPPQDIDSEQAALGSMMIDRKALCKAASILRGGDFYRPSHSTVFDALCALNLKDEPVDLITLQEELRSRDQLEQIGGTEYLMSLISQVPSARRVEYYAKIVQNKAMLRRLMSAGQEIQALAFSESDGSSACDGATEILLGLRRNGVGDELIPMSAAIQEAWDTLGEKIDAGGVSLEVRTGISNLDRQTMGVNPGLTVIGARPSAGKTSLIFEIIRRSREYGPFLVFSIETGQRSLANRLMASESGVSLQRIRSGRPWEDELGRLLEACNELHRLPVFLACGSITMARLAAVTKMAILEHGVRTIFVDYAQLIQAPGNSEYERLVNVSIGLKNLAIDGDLRVVAAVQLNREPEKRRGSRSPEDAEPRLSDIKGCGQFEQDADLAILIHNPEPKNEADRSAGRQCKLIIAKQKDGPTGASEAWWDGSTLRFSGLENEMEEPL